MKFEFMECDTCAAKPGTPALCAGCLTNRVTIETLNRQLPDHIKALSLATDIRSLLIKHSCGEKVQDVIQINKTNIWRFVMTYMGKEYMIGIHEN